MNTSRHELHELHEHDDMETNIVQYLNCSTPKLILLNYITVNIHNTHTDTHKNKQTPTSHTHTYTFGFGLWEILYIVI